jgi:hypothetical protein
MNTQKQVKGWGLSGSNPEWYELICRRGCIPHRDQIGLA